MPTQKGATSYFHAFCQVEFIDQGKHPSVQDMIDSFVEQRVDDMVREWKRRQRKDVQASYQRAMPMDRDFSLESSEWKHANNRVGVMDRPKGESIVGTRTHGS